MIFPGKISGSFGPLNPVLDGDRIHRHTKNNCTGNPISGSGLGGEYAPSDDIRVTVVTYCQNTRVFRIHLCGDDNDEISGC